MSDKLIFHAYSEIENSYRTKHVNLIVEQGKGGGEWVVTEKVHGSNFSMWYDGTELKGAKRSGFLVEPHSFFNADKVMAENKAGIERIFNILILNHNQKVMQGIESVKPEVLTIYGEIFGGSYPHPDVSRVVGATRVQKGVYYHPDNLFYAFDIKINGALVDYDTFAALCDAGNIFRTKPLFRGTLQDCLAFNNVYKSTIPGRLGLPEIDEPNICEGNVIVPVIPERVWGGGRVILKNKNEYFSEVAHGKKGPKMPKEEVQVSDATHESLEIMSTYVTENRLRNVISKIGTVTDKDFGLLMREMSHDVIEDFMKDNRDAFLLLDKNEQKYITKKMGADVALLIRSNFLNIIDNSF